MTEQERRAKAAERTREWRLKNRDHANRLDRIKYLRKRYGISPEDYDRMHLQQNGLCKLCSKPETIINGRGRTKSRLAVDHCHSSGKVRGLLCFRCNTAIGQIEKENLSSKLPDYLGESA